MTYAFETRRLGCDAVGVLYRKGRETPRRLLERRCLGPIEDASWSVSRPLEAEYASLLEEWEDARNFGLACRGEVEHTYAATRGF